MRMRWAAEGGGTTSITDWMVQEERESHCEKTSWSSCFVSFDFSSRGGIFRLSAVTIFVTLSGLLHGRSEGEYEGALDVFRTHGFNTTAS